jgi:ADP-ribosylglycohydrolase
MLGAIIGDILGSTHEKIPNLPMRKTPKMTDDSFLTFAAADWMLGIDFSKFNFLFPKSKKEETSDWNRFKNELIKSAEKALIKWYDIGIQANKDDTNGIPIFSPGFAAWVNAKKTKEIFHVKKKGNTNGCLMRNSPIPFFGFKNQLDLVKIIFLSKIFCKVTHPHEESLNAVKTHSTIILMSLMKEINSYNIRDSIRKFNISIKPISEWIPLADGSRPKFIWDAKTSLDIAYSSIYYSQSFNDCIEFCNTTEMDTDTYCAIAGPIAQALWGIKQKTKLQTIDKITVVKEALPILKHFDLSTNLTD